MEKTKGMRIVALEAENFKRLKVVSIKPSGDIIQITGKNGQGKTSVLDAIWAALAGKSVIQKKPIRTGATEAVIKLDLGHLKVKRTFREGKEGGPYSSTITVESADGGKFSSPQDVLDNLIGEFALDPVALMELDPEELFNSLRQFVPGVDFDQIDRLNRADYDRRTELNRTAKTLRAQAEGIKVPDNLPAARVDEGDLVQQLGRAAETNAGIMRSAEERKQTQALIAQFNDDAAKRRARAVELRKQADELDANAAQDIETAAQHAADLEKAPALPPLVDTAELQGRIAAARQANAALDLAARREDIIGDAEIAESEATSLSGQIDARDAAKMKAIAEAKMPIDGIGFGEKTVLLNGEPFDQASDAEKWIAAVSIAAAMNPQLRVIRIRQGSLLDEDAMKFLADFAEKNDLQVWVERVDSSGKVGIVLEDGMVKEQPAAEAAE
jgi:DNA repair exonuclease SbcCD ATPase subunit